MVATAEVSAYKYVWMGMPLRKAISRPAHMPPKGSNNTMPADAAGKYVCETERVSRLLAGLDRGACVDAECVAAAAATQAVA